MLLALKLLLCAIAALGLVALAAALLNGRRRNQSAEETYDREDPL